ncbi:MAG: ribosome small subunit-dependent GTPase A [Myxococcales bacterium]|nr:ribosome small subunit-dependent GTPase A [Myxococcales bacterium]
MIDDAQRSALAELGDPALVAARVASISREHVELRFDGVADVVRGELAARFARDDDPLARPTVGDLVAVRRDDAGAAVARVEALLPRRSVFVRAAAGRRARPQLVAANVDRVLIVGAVGAELSARRIERYIAAVLAGGAEACVVINKCDRPHDAAALRAELGMLAPGVPLVLTSAVDERCVSDLAPYVGEGVTLALVGSSGVGKSTLIRRLLGRGEAISTAAVREADDKGRHTTTRRTLYLAESGALIIDTPGMREIGLWDADEGLEQAFADIVALAESCHFRDCAHAGEPGCAIDGAVQAGHLPEARLASYQRLQREIVANARRAEEGGYRAKRAFKPISRAIRARKRAHRKLGIDKD